MKRDKHLTTASRNLALQKQRKYKSKQEDKKQAVIKKEKFILHVLNTQKTEERLQDLRGEKL